MIDQKEPGNVEYFNYLCSMITNDARCTREFESRIDIAKAGINTKKVLFTSKYDVNLRKKLVKYGTENWTLRKVNQKYL